MDMDTTDKIVSLNDIDLHDLSFIITAGRGSEAIARSVQQVGLLQPPLLVFGGAKKTYRIVCGFLRIQAIAALGWQDVPAKICDPKTDERQLLLCALHDNLSHRVCNPVERAYAVERLFAFFPREDILANWQPLLGLPPTGRALEDPLLLARLDADIQESVHQGGLSEKNALRLSALEQDDRRALFKLMCRVHLSSSKQAELIENCCDLARRDAVSLRQIVNHEDIAAILGHEKLNLSQKGDQLRQWVRKRRFPGLTRSEQRFAAAHKKLHLPRGIELFSPPFFEGDTYRVEIEFTTAGALDKAGDEIKRLAHNPVLKELLEEIE
jgi:ParB-like chromosome segregation protein Spo0J